MLMSLTCGGLKKMTSSIGDDVTLVNTGQLIDWCSLIKDMDKRPNTSCSVPKVLCNSQQPHLVTHPVLWPLKTFFFYQIWHNRPCLGVKQFCESDVTCPEPNNPNKSTNCFPVYSPESCHLSEQPFWFRSADFLHLCPTAWNKKKLLTSSIPVSVRKFCPSWQHWLFCSGAGSWEQVEQSSACFC